MKKSIDIRQGNSLRFESSPDEEWTVMWIGKRYLILARPFAQRSWYLSVLDNYESVRYRLSPFDGDRVALTILSQLLADEGMMAFAVPLDDERMPLDFIEINGVRIPSGGEADILIHSLNESN